MTYINRQLVDDYLKQHGQLLICISGPSGAGKTHHAEQLAKELGLAHIDQDSFFKGAYDLPKIKLSNGLELHNWDSVEALDLEDMNATIHEYLPNGVIFSGFACRDSWFKMPIDFQIHLNINQKTCLSRRREKGVDPDKFAKIMVKECVFPFYNETLTHSRIDATIYANKKTDRTMISIKKYVDQFLQSKV